MSNVLTPRCPSLSCVSFTTVYAFMTTPTEMCKGGNKSKCKVKRKKKVGRNGVPSKRLVNKSPITSTNVMK